MNCVWNIRIFNCHLYLVPDTLREFEFALNEKLVCWKDNILFVRHVPLVLTIIVIFKSAAKCYITWVPVQIFNILWIFLSYKIVLWRNRARIIFTVLWSYLLGPLNKMLMPYSCFKFHICCSSKSSFTIFNSCVNFY